MLWVCLVHGSIVVCGFCHGFVVVGPFWSWVCCRGWALFIGLPPLVGFVMGLPSWMGFGCGYAAMGCGFVAMDRFWSWVIGGGVNVNGGL